MYEMTPEYYTGVDFVDKEHEKLFDLANEAYDLLFDSFLQDKTDRIIHLISELIDYTRTHFSHEEAYQEQIGYARRSAHAVLHRQFEDRLAQFDLSSLSDDFEEQNKAVEELLDFLISWLTDHIMKVDMLYVQK